MTCRIESSLSPSTSKWTSNFVKKTINTVPLSPPRIEPNTVVVMRGLPGSGKTAMVNAIHDDLYDRFGHEEFLFFTISGDNQPLVYDPYDYDSNGLRKTYLYDASHVVLTQQWCIERFDRIMSMHFLRTYNGPHPPLIIVIDNPNLTVSEVEYYWGQSQGRNMKFQIVEPETEWKMDPDICVRMTRTGAPRSEIEKMKNRYSPYTEADIAHYHEIKKK